MTTIGNRYTRDRILKQLPEGALHQGTDLTFHRSVLIYTYDETDKIRQDERLRWLSKASRVTGERFLHLLDYGTDAGILYVVLQTDSGGLLSDQLRQLPLTGRQAIQYVHGLALAVRDARVERLPECTLDAENLWMDANGRLRIVNFWTEGGIGRRGVPGLSLLLYQLGARTDVPTASIREFSYELGGLLADLPDEQRSTAVALACQAYEGNMTLSDFQTGLAALLRGDEGRAMAARPPVSEGRESIGLRPAPAKVAERISRPRVSFPWRRQHAYVVAACVLLALLLWLVWQPLSNGSRAASPEPTRHPSPQPTSTSSVPPATSPLPAAIRPSSTVAPSAIPTAIPSTAASPGNHTEKMTRPSGTVPDLTGHKLEEAEQLAIAAGLRYQYFLQPNGAPQGNVFKQDLAPGTTVQEGERITLWVSKGKE